MIDNLCTHSGYSRKLLLESSMMHDRLSIEKSYEVMRQFYHVVDNEDNKNIVHCVVLIPSDASNCSRCGRRT